MSKNICVRFCDGVPQRLHPSALLCLAYVRPSACAPGKVKRIQVSAVMSGCVMLLRGGQARPVPLTAVRETERREIVEQGLYFRLPADPGISRILRGVV